jgi:hypothetical protein
MTNDDILYHMFQCGQITLEEYLKTQELPSETIRRLKKAIEIWEKKS